MKLNNQMQNILTLKAKLYKEMNSCVCIDLVLRFPAGPKRHMRRTVLFCSSENKDVMKTFAFECIKNKGGKVKVERERLQIVSYDFKLRTPPFEIMSQLFYFEQTEENIKQVNDLWQEKYK